MEVNSTQTEQLKIFIWMSIKHFWPAYSYILAGSVNITQLAKFSGSAFLMLWHQMFQCRSH